MRKHAPRWLLHPFGPSQVQTACPCRPPWTAGETDANGRSSSRNAKSVAGENPSRETGEGSRHGGAVFLPAAGNRNGTEVNNVGSNGNYWSSTVNSSNNAYNLNFNSGNANTNNNNNRNNGFSVRLVR